MKFNVNEYVMVKLTEIGKAELRKQNDELRAVVKSLRPYSEPEEDDQGYTKYQLWDLMSTFGHLMVMGCEPPFETDIIVVKGDTNG